MQTRSPAHGPASTHASVGGAVTAKLLLALCLALVALGGCATVRPEQRAVLADPVMQFQNDPGEEAALQHVLENREGSYGGGSVQGGGCGCN